MRPFASTLRVLPVLVCGLLWLPAPGRAATINIDFESNGSAHYSGTGAAPDLGTFWNSVGLGGAVNLLTSTGAATSVNVSTRDFYGDFTYPGANPLTFDRLYGVDDGIGYIDIGSLTPNGAYDIYLYASFWDAIYSAPGSTTEIATGDSLGTSWMEGDQYVALLGALADGAGNLTVTVSATGSPNGMWVNVAGLQLVGAAAEPVPEPGTLALVGGGLLLAAQHLRARRR